MKKLIILFFILVLSFSVQAREWWVSPDCHNLSDTTIGTTNLNSDSCNIVVAFQNAQYGDVIYLQQGVYTYVGDYITSSDYWLTLNDSNIAIIGVGDVILDGNLLKGIMDIEYCDSIYITNIKFRNAKILKTDAPIRGVGVNTVYSTKIVINNCVFENIQAGVKSYSISGIAVYLYDNCSLKNSLIKNCHNIQNATYDGWGYGAVSALKNNNIINNTIVNNYIEVNVSGDAGYGVAIYMGGTDGGNVIENCIIYGNYGAGTYKANVESIIYSANTNNWCYNSIFYNNYDYSGDERYQLNEVNTRENAPSFIDISNEWYYLNDTSIALNNGIPEKGIYRNIGCYSKAAVYGKAETYAWQGWTDENGDTISEGLSNYFYIDTGDSSLRLSDLYDTGIAISPIIYVGEYPRYFSVDLEVYEKTDLTFGQKQCIDFDETTQEREIQYRTGNTPSEVLSASWQNAVANRDISITKKYIQIRLKFNKLVEY